MDRFYISPAQWSDSLALIGEEAHHCRRVMRKRVGEMIELFDGCGNWARGEIVALNDSVSLSIKERGTSPKPKLLIELAVGIPKGKIFDLIIQKSVELGVNRIQPLMTDQGVVKILEKDAAKKAAKWQRLAIEACKQCGQNWLPVIKEAATFSDWLPNRQCSDLELVAALTSNAVPLGPKLSEISKSPELCSIRIFVGPEGDFSKSEYANCFVHDVIPVKLGDLVLKVETAVIFLVSNICAQLRT